VGAFHFRALSLPFWALVVGMAMLGVTGAVLRGDRMRRVGVLVISACTLPWATSDALAACTDDRLLALHLVRAGLGPVAIVGPAMMFIVLSDAGKLDGHRALTVFATVIAVLSMVLTWATSLVVTGVRVVGGGILYPEAGPLNGPHVGQIALWAGIGIWIARRGQRQARDQARRLVIRIGLLAAGLAIVATSDFLISAGLWRSFPISWAAALLGAVLGMWALWRANRLRDDGYDRRGAIEMIATVIGGAAVVGVVVAGGAAQQPLEIAALTAPIAACALVAGLWGRGKEPTRRLASVTGDEMLGFAEQVQSADTDDEIAAQLVEFLGDGVGATQIRVWRMGPDGLAALTDDSPPPSVDARVRAWLIANRAPIVVGDVPSMRLGGMRALIEGLVAAADADVIAPLVDRDAVLGLIALRMPDGRTPRPADRELMADAAQSAAQAITFTTLRREAEARAETAREVEVADAMQQARADGDVRIDVGHWRVMACYRPGGKVAGDVWTWAELRGGDLLLVVGDVIGRGLSAALIAAAVAGAVESSAALRGEALDPVELLQLLHETVISVSGTTPTLGAIAIVMGRGRVRWATAGHRGAYRVRSSNGAPTSAVIALTAAGTPLGERRLHLGSGEADLAPGDLILIASDGVIDVTDARGVRWSERHLLRALRTWVPQAGDGAAEQLVSAAAAHAGDTPLDDDLVVLAARARG
jgi:serine phosphatase RsbU (regulator of sigma subunit)